MGQKTNPTLLRLNKTNQHWSSCWYSDNDYAAQFLEDCKINTYVNNCYQQLKRIPAVFFIKRQRGELRATLFSTKPAPLFTRIFSRHSFREKLPVFLGRPIKTIDFPFTHTANRQGANNGHWVAHSNEKTSIPLVFLPQVISSSTLRVTDKKLTPPTLSIEKKREFFKLFLFVRKWGLISHGAYATLPAGTIATNINTNKNFHDNFFGLYAAAIQKDTHHFDTKSCLGTAQKKQGGDNLYLKQIRAKMPLKNHMESCVYNSTQLFSKIHILKCPSIHQNPLFLAGQIVSLLQERVAFRRLKHRVIEEIRKDANIKGIRITCSGRVAARSKKAQKARTDSIQWGATSLNIFSEFLGFASCYAQTTFGKVGVKVWICYEKERISYRPLHAIVSPRLSPVFTSSFHQFSPTAR